MADTRRENAVSLLMSLSMSIEFGSSDAHFVGWCREAGFRRFGILPLGGLSNAAILHK